MATGYSKNEKIDPWVSKSEGKGTKSEPRDTKSEPKGSQRKPKGSQREPKGAKREPNGEEKQHKINIKDQVAKKDGIKVTILCFLVVRPKKFWSILGAISINKR